MQAWGSAFMGVTGGGLGFMSSLLASLKRKSGDEGMGRRGITAVASSLGHLGSFWKGTLMGGSGLVPSLVVWLVVAGSSSGGMFI